MSHTRSFGPRMKWSCENRRRSGTGKGVALCAEACGRYHQTLGICSAQLRDRAFVQTTPCRFAYGRASTKLASESLLSAPCPCQDNDLQRSTTARNRLETDTGSCRMARF
ncbi:hypothetical protein KC327_g19 [Hortaea werneckii]|nr:hypothetical protein KC327_g19 [Hortaea werneckii]